MQTRVKKKEKERKTDSLAQGNHADPRCSFSTFEGCRIREVDFKAFFFFYSRVFSECSQSRNIDPPSSNAQHPTGE